MSAIYQREFKLSPIEFVKFQLYNSINLPTPLLNETDVTVLAYIYLYGNAAKKKIIDHRILTNVNSFTNYVSRLRSMDYIEPDNVKGRSKDRKPLKLNPNIIIVNESHVQITKIELDNTSSKVNHPYYKDDKSDKNEKYT